MDANKIEKFIDAGYTKQEIELLFKDPKVDPEQKPEPEQKNENSDNSNLDQNSSQTNSDNDTMAEAIKTLTNTVNALSDTVKAMQAANINNDKTETNKDNTVESVMKSFIEKL